MRGAKSPLLVNPFIFTSKYSQRMRKLSCKIFNDFYVPELNRREDLAYRNSLPVIQWANKWFTDLRAYERSQARPFDLNPAKKDYYPPHPQFRKLTHELREYGLFRDEHRDFNEAMKEVALARGKTFGRKREPKKNDEKK